MKLLVRSESFWDQSGGSDAAVCRFLAVIRGGKSLRTMTEEKMRRKLLWLVMAVAVVMPAFGAPIVNLASASAFGLLGDTISNTGVSVINGYVGVQDSGGPITGFYTPGTTSYGPAGVLAPGNATASAAYADFVTAFNLAFSNITTPTTQPAPDFTSSYLFTGDNVYNTALAISTTTGITLTFDAQNNPNEYFIIRTSGPLTVNGAMTFTLENGAQASNIFWIVGTDATISVGSSGPITFDGNILAGDTFTMSAASGGSGVLTGDINGCVFAENANTLAGTTDVGGCSSSVGAVPEPGTLSLLSMGLGAGFLLLRKFRTAR